MQYGASEAHYALEARARGEEYPPPPPPPPPPPAFQVEPPQQTRRRNLFPQDNGNVTFNGVDTLQEQPMATANICGPPGGGKKIGKRAGACDLGGSTSTTTSSPAKPRSVGITLPTVAETGAPVPSEPMAREPPSVPEPMVTAAATTYTTVAYHGGTSDDEVAASAAAQQMKTLPLPSYKPEEEAGGKLRWTMAPKYRGRREGRRGWEETRGEWWNYHGDEREEREKDAVGSRHACVCVASGQF